MSDLDGIVSISISGAVPQVSEPGFGTPMVAACRIPSSWGAARVKSYTGTQAMTADGFDSTYPAYQVAAAMFAQTPPPAAVKVGRRAHTSTQTVHLTPVDPASVNGLVYSVTIDGGTATVTTSGSHNTLSEVCNDLAGQINALGGTPVSAVATPASPSSTHIVCTSSTAGLVHSYGFPSDTTTTHYQPIQIFDATTDAGGTSGLNDDLSKIDQADGDWYFLLLDSNSIAEATVAAVYMEARGFGELVTQTADTGNATTGSVLDPASTTDFMYLLKNAGYTRTFYGYVPGIFTTGFAPAMVGSRATATPGSDTWWGKTLAGVSAYTLTPTQKSAVLGKNGNVYTTIAGVSIVQNGTMANGGWADSVRFLDWLKQSIQVALFTLLTNNGGKVPYTDAGADLVAGAIRSVLKAGIKAGGLNPGAPAGTDNTGTPYPAIPAPSVYTPPVASISPATRATRNFPGVTFSAQGAGAIQGVIINGSVQ